MTRSHYLSVLALAIAVAACDSGATPTEPMPQASEDEVTSVLVSMIGGDPTADSRGGNSLFDRLAEEIPGFGGLYRNGVCSVAVVLTDMSKAELAIEKVKQALEPLVRCTDGIRVHPVEGQYTYEQLTRWHRIAQPVLRIDGVRAMTINYQQNRIVVHVAARSVAQKVIEVLQTLDVALAAFVFQLTGSTSTRG